MISCSNILSTLNNGHAMINESLEIFQLNNIKLYMYHKNRVLCQTYLLSTCEHKCQIINVDCLPEENKINTRSISVQHSYNKIH